MTDNLPTLITDGSLIPRQADTDAQVLALWLHGRSKHTIRAYESDAKGFMSCSGKSLHATTLGDIQSY